MKGLLLLAAAVPLFGQSNCTYSVSPNAFVAAAGATNTTTSGNIPSFVVTTQTNCLFVVGTAASWIHVAPPPNGTSFVGTSTVTFTLDQNATDQLRKDQILVYPGATAGSTAGAQTASVTQVAGICNYSLSSTSASVPATGGFGNFTVTTGCAWTANTPANFITLAAPAGAVGSGLLNYQTAANTCAAPRTGQITVQTGAFNPPVYQVSQAGNTNGFSLSSTSVTIGSAALTNQHITVTTGSVCSWTTYTDSGNWLHTVVNGSGTGNGVYTYSIDANQGAQRVGHIYFQSGTDANGNPVLAGTLTITQQPFQVPAPQLSAVVNDASYDIGSPAPAPISPGEIVALFGSNLGPSSGVSSGPSFGTTLSNVQVLFGSTPAPLIYVSAQQVNAVVPYTLTGNSVTVAVQYNGVSSGTLTIPLQATTPGIFSQDRSGSGPGAILNNADFSVNQGARPAAAGSVIDIYCTGAGVTSPAAVDGSVIGLTPPFASLVAQPVTVTIGGVPAQVVYAGPAPGSIAGLTQIDAVVPGGLRTGSVPIVVTIGGVSSQGNLSVAIQ